MAAQITAQSRRGSNKTPSWITLRHIRVTTSAEHLANSSVHFPTFSTRMVALTQPSKLFCVYRYSRDSVAFGSSMHLAFYFGLVEIAVVLFEKGLPYDNRDHLGQTSLFWASVDGHEAIAQLLIDKGATINSTNRGGRTALHNAPRDAQKQIARELRRCR